MLYPFIYTGTRFHDFRLVTSQMLGALPKPVVQSFTDVARTMINADNSRLVEPSWALVKKDGYILWGMAVMNSKLSDKNQDDDGRPVRGFFGIVSDATTARLPYSISYFKELYRAYVEPIWDTYIQTEQTTCPVPAVSGSDFIEKSSFAGGEINLAPDICRIFPAGVDNKALIQAVFAAPGNCSIATDLHSKSQCVEFGRDKFSFANAVMAPDAHQSSTTDVKVYVKQISQEHRHDVHDGQSVTVEQNLCALCGRPVVGSDYVCDECKARQRRKKLIKYTIYAILAILVLWFFLRDLDIWKSIELPKRHLPSVFAEEVKPDLQADTVAAALPFLKSFKKEVRIENAAPDDTFRIGYESSSPLAHVEASGLWLTVVTAPEQYAAKGDIEFTCKPNTGANRSADINIVNEEGRKLVVAVHQSGDAPTVLADSITTPTAES